MTLILVSDVFGITPALIEFGKIVNAEIIADPYGGENLGFQSEAEAYSYFTEHVGLEAYHSIILELTLTAPLSSTLIGFSVGATVVWRLSGNSSVKNISRAICFYGSQIRKFRSVNPLFDVTLIFPVSEPHFDVVELQEELSSKRNVKIQKSNVYHGFMNAYSNNFNRAVYENHIEWLNLNLS
ncbi:hypothetical protein H5202_19555 [Shewanella sp. SG41-4]|uniref:hypothetical protein n=1 Tax=Shewanella sp. SG41-4 TaxID=2760976 RepID=UPI0015FEBD53|nr:hypothetical protein [Shewanella sp. SG41-4]MBB1440816.1 hypothetical protein [Shewanella sp. SG41-4]